MEKKLVKKVNEVVSDCTDVPIADIISNSRREDVIDARYMAVYILTQKLGVSYNVICECYNVTKFSPRYIRDTFIDKTREKPYLAMAYRNAIKQLKNDGIIG